MPLPASTSNPEGEFTEGRSNGHPMKRINYWVASSILLSASSSVWAPALNAADHAIQLAQSDEDKRRREREEQRQRCERTKSDALARCLDRVSSAFRASVIDGDTIEIRG
jgi:hypothetical protein